LHVATTVAPEAAASPTCRVFVDPDASTAVIAGIGDRLRQRPEVINLQLVSQQQAYEEFLRLFAGKDDLTRSVTADMLPPRWTFDLDPDTTANQQAITAELGNDLAVKQTKCT
jgi:cell division protein FtsX